MSRRIQHRKNQQEVIRDCEACGCYPGAKSLASLGSQPVGRYKMVDWVCTAH